MRVRVGPVGVQYRGVARVASVDRAARRAVFHIEGRETRGQGSASATISNELSQEDGSTRVHVATDLSVTGRPAQFGRGVMQEVAAAILADFALGLSRMLAEENSEKADEQPSAVEGGQIESLMLGRAVRRALRRRLGRATNLDFLRRLRPLASRRRR
jgi:uncharacterized protein